MDFLRPGVDYELELRKQPIDSHHLIDVIYYTFRTLGPTPVHLPRSHYQAQIDELMKSFSPKFSVNSYDNVHIRLREMGDHLRPAVRYQHAKIYVRQSNGEDAFEFLTRSYAREAVLNYLLPNTEYDVTV